MQIYNAHKVKLGQYIRHSVVRGAFRIFERGRSRFHRLLKLKCRNSLTSVHWTLDVTNEYVLVSCSASIVSSEVLARAVPLTR